jgi:RNA polymerase sigma factor (sigma-70 family)
MSSPHLTDTALVQAALRRDPAAWKTLVARYDRVLRAVCHTHRLSSADAEDVRQTTWLRAVEQLDRVRDPQRVGVWLATVARNECLRILRQHARVRPCEDELMHSVPDQGPSPDAALLAAERRVAVHGALTKLSARDRTLLNRLYHETEPSYAEIGSALRMPLGSIGPTRGRVLERLRRSEQLARLVLAA